MTTALWIPSPERAAAAAITAFRKVCAAGAGIDLPDSAALHRWSVTDPAAFWDAVWDHFGVVGDKGERRLVDSDRMPGARFFPDARLNFAENLLARPGAPDDDAIVFRAEDKAAGRLSWGDLAALVSRLQQRSAPPASASAIGSPACCPTFRRRWRPCWRPPRSARSGRPPRPISAPAVCSTASARSSRRCSSRSTATGTPASAARSATNSPRSCRSCRRPRRWS